MTPTFTRGFRLHHNGRIVHGAVFPNGEVIVADDPQYGLGTAALSLEDLLKNYHGARVEWPGDQLVPSGLLDELLRITTYVSRGQAAVGDGEQYPEAAARAVLSRLTEYLGADIVARAGQPVGAERFRYERDHDAELLLNGLPPEAQQQIRAQLAAEGAEGREESDAAEKHVNVNLDFVTDADPASVGARVVEIVVAGIAERLTGANWHGFELGGDQEQEPADG